MKTIVGAVFFLGAMFAAVTAVATIVTFIAALINGNWGAFFTAFVLSIIAQVSMGIIKLIARAMF